MVLKGIIPSHLEAFIVSPMMLIIIPPWQPSLLTIVPLPCIIEGKLIREYFPHHPLVVEVSAIIIQLVFTTGNWFRQTFLSHHKLYETMVKVC